MENYVKIRLRDEMLMKLHSRYRYKLCFFIWFWLVFLLFLLLFLGIFQKNKEQNGKKYTKNKIFS